jgi:preprotein translocase subunit YajC
LSGGFLIILILIFGLMYFLMIRPQRQQQRAHQEMLNNLKVGDEVITAGGIYGDVVAVEPDRVSLEIAEDVEIEVARRAIASIVVPEPDEDADELSGAEPEETEPVAEAEPEETEPVAEAERTAADDGADRTKVEDAAERAQPEQARR